MAENDKKTNMINHFTFISRKLWKFCMTNFLTDLVLSCKDGQLSAHRAVLARVMRMAGMEDDMFAEDNIIIIPDAKVAEVELALKTLYLKLDAWSFFSIVFFGKITGNVRDSVKENTGASIKLENETNNEVPTMIKEIVSGGDGEFNDDPSGNLSANLLPEATLTQIENNETKKRRGRPKGCTDKIKRKTYTFECRECDKTIKGRLAYKRHMRKNHGMPEKKSVGMDVKSKCPYCEKILANIYVFKSHVAHVHRKEAFLYHPEIEFKKKCDDCEERYFNICDLGKHTKEKHGKITRKFRCNFCSDEFGDKTTLYNHRLQLHEKELGDSELTGFIKNIACPYCVKMFSLKNRLNRHVYNKHADKLHLHPEINPKHYCGQCEEKFYAKQDLSAHNALHHGQEFECKLCDMTFKHKGSRDKHVEVAHNDETHICEICSSIFKTKSGIRTHMKRRHSDKPRYKYPCKLCTQGAQSKETLEKHIENNHKGRQFMCSFCPSTFSSEDGRSIHERRIHTEKNIQCQQCDKKFSKTCFLNAHIRSAHIRKKDKQCPFCEKEFYDTNTFKCHVNRHTDNRQFSCETCGKAFLTDRDLKKHFAVHLLPHKCHLCEKKYSTNGLLEDHIRKHAGIKLECRHTCGHSYMDRRGRERHERTCNNNPQRGVSWGAISKQIKGEL